MKVIPAKNWNVIRSCKKSEKMGQATYQQHYGLSQFRFLEDDLDSLFGHVSVSDSLLST